MDRFEVDPANIIYLGNRDIPTVQVTRGPDPETRGIALRIEASVAVGLEVFSQSFVVHPRSRSTEAYILEIEQMLVRNVREHVREYQETHGSHVSHGASITATEVRERRRWVPPSTTWNQTQIETTYTIPTAGLMSDKEAFGTNEINEAYATNETTASKKAWEESVLEYAKDVCSRAGIRWQDAWASELEKAKTKVDVNKIVLFDLAKRVEDKPGLPKEAISFLKGMMPHTQESRFQSLEQDINTYMRETEGLHTRIRQYAEATAVKRREIAKLFSIDESEVYLEQVEKVLATNLWQYHGLEANCLVFRSTNPVVMKWKDDPKGIDMVVNLGTFLVKVDFKSPDLRAKALDLKPEHRVTGNGTYFHPHVGASNTGWGGICWGNASRAFDGFVKDANLVDAMNALWMLLNTYNDDSPYMALSSFWVLQNKEHLKKQPKQLMKFRRAWVQPSVVEDRDNLETLSEREDDEGDTQFLVQTWKFKYTVFGIWDEDKLYLAGPRGGQPFEISEETDVVDWY